MPWKKDAEHEDGNIKTSAKVQVTESVREWDYGDYEGLTSKYIGEQRQQAGLHKWDIWKDGCPGGESPDQITERLDAVIAEIREKYHKDAIGKACKEAGPHDVLIVAHGHILRAFAARWINKNIADNPSMLLDAGGVGTLRYAIPCKCQDKRQRLT